MKTSLRVAIQRKTGFSPSGVCCSSRHIEQLCQAEQFLGSVVIHILKMDSFQGKR